MRKLASLRRIADISPIPGADSIEVASVGGWKVVVKKGEFSVGDLAVYCEIDSWIPTEIAPFLSKGNTPREYEGVYGERLKTIKLRGQVSQGLLLKPDIDDTSAFKIGKISFPCVENLDVSEFLGVKRWEPPVPANLSGEVKGIFPKFLRKTDQERVQNLVTELSVWRDAGFTWEVTEKLDGSSMTVYLNREDYGVCSRNLDIKENNDNTYWKVAKESGIIDKLIKLNRNIAIQGELIGEGIQKNRYNIRGHAFYVYDIFDIDTTEYLSPLHRVQLCDNLLLKHVPVVYTHKEFRPSVDDILTSSEGTSKLYNTEREGIVFKCNEVRHSFKAISNKFLLKGGE